MAITMALLTSGKSTTDGTGFTTASISPTADRILFCVSFCRDFGGSNVAGPTIAGLSMNWNKAVDNNPSNASAGIGISWAATGSAPATGTLTITWAITAENCQWHVFEAAGINISHPIGPTVAKSGNAVSGTAYSLTMTHTNSANGALVAWLNDSPTVTTTEEGGWTELYDTQQAEFLVDSSVETMWRADNDTSPTATGSGSANWIGCGVELRDASVTLAKMLPSLGIGF